MSHTSCAITDQLVAITIDHFRVTLLGGVFVFRCLGKAKDVRPLLERFREVLVVERVVFRTVP